MSDRDAWASAGARVSYREGPIQGIVGVAHGLNDLLVFWLRRDSISRI